MKRYFSVLLLASFMMLAGLAEAACSSGGCGGTGSSDGITIDCTMMQPYLMVVGLVSGILMGLLILTFGLGARKLSRTRKSGAFRFGLIPGVIFYGQSIFCVGIGLMIGCFYSAITSGIGLALGTVFFIIMVHRMNF